MFVGHHAHWILYGLETQDPHVLVPLYCGVVTSEQTTMWVGTAVGGGTGGAIGGGERVQVRFSTPPAHPLNGIQVPVLRESFCHKLSPAAGHQEQSSPKTFATQVEQLVVGFPDKFA